MSIINWLLFLCITIAVQFYLAIGIAITVDVILHYDGIRMVSVAKIIKTTAMWLPIYLRYKYRTRKEKAIT